MRRWRLRICRLLSVRFGKGLSEARQKQYAIAREIFRNCFHHLFVRSAPLTVHLLCDCKVDHVVEALGEVDRKFQGAPSRCRWTSSNIKSARCTHAGDQRIEFE